MRKQTNKYSIFSTHPCVRVNLVTTNLSADRLTTQESEFWVKSKTSNDLIYKEESTEVKRRKVGRKRGMEENESYQQ